MNTWITLKHVNKDGKFMFIKYTCSLTPAVMMIARTSTALITYHLLIARSSIANDVNYFTCNTIFHQLFFINVLWVAFLKFRSLFHTREDHYRRNVAELYERHRWLAVRRSRSWVTSSEVMKPLKRWTGQERLQRTIINTQ